MPRHPSLATNAQNVGNSLAGVEPMRVDSSGEICKAALLRHNLFVY
jgi:hypothetical protein